MKKLGTATIVLMVGIGMFASPATGLRDKKPNPATKRACENFIDFTNDTAGSGTPSTVREGCF